MKIQSHKDICQGSSLLKKAWERTSRVRIYVVYAVSHRFCTCRTTSIRLNVTIGWEQNEILVQKDIPFRQIYG